MPFRKQDREWLFGRDKDVILMQSRIFSGRTTLLFAGSGVGKTSFLNARIAPDLEDQFDIVFHRDWSGGVEPLKSLLDSINQTIEKSYPKLEAPQIRTAVPLGDERIIAADRPEPQASANEKQPGPLGSALQIFNTAAESSVKTKPNGCLLILDQFEEVFQYYSYEKHFKTFVSGLSDLINDGKCAVRIIFSMREEFLGELSVFDNRIPDLFNNYYRLKHPDQEGARNIILRTCMRAKVQIDETNLDQLVRDLSKVEKVSTGAGKSTENGEKVLVSSVERDIVPPPYLQIACLKLWERQFASAHDSQNASASFLATYQPDDARLMLEEFIGEKLRVLNDEEQGLASRAFDFLVTKQGAKMAYQLSQLATHMGVDEQKLERTLEKLSADEVRILRKSGAEGDRWFELYHDIYGTIVDRWKERYRRGVREEMQKREAAQRTAQRKRIGAVAVIAALVTTAIIVLWYSRARARENAANAINSAALLETAAIHFESLERRDEALIARLVALRRIKGLDPELEQRHRLEISRLISDDYPSLLATFREQGAGETSNARFSADGKAVMTQGLDGTIRLWDTDTGEPISVPADWTQPAPRTQPPDRTKIQREDRTGDQQSSTSSNLPGPEVTSNEREKLVTEQTAAERARKLPTQTYMVGAVKHPKYHFLIAGIDGDTRKIFIWRADNGQLLGEPLTGIEYPSGLNAAFSPDGNFIAINKVAKSNPIVWKISDDKPILVSSIRSPEDIRYIAFSPDSKYLLTTGGTTILWDLSTERPKLNIAAGESIYGASFSPDGKRIVTLSGGTRIWNAETGTEEGSLVQTGLTEKAPRFTADNQTLISESEIGPLSFWDAKTGARRDESFWIHGKVDSYRIHPGSQTVLTTSDGVARLWQLIPRKIEKKSFPFNDSVPNGLLSFDGTKLISPRGQSYFKLFDIEKGQPLGSSFLNTLVSSNGSYQLTLNDSDPYNFHLWDVAAQQEIARFIYRPLSAATAFDVSPDRQFLYVQFENWGSKPGIPSVTAAPSFVMILKINSDKTGSLLSNPTRYDGARLGFSPNSKYLGAMARDKTSTSITVWELSSNRKIPLTQSLLYPQAESLSALVFSQDGGLITQVADNQAFMWELPDGGRLHLDPVTYSSRITSSKFSPDGKYFFCGYEDGAVVVWDVATAAQLSSFDHGGRIRQLEFDSSGDEVFVATNSWVHLLSWNNNQLSPLASRLIDEDWIPPFRFLNAPEISRIRLLSAAPFLLTVQDIDFAQPENREAIEGDPQQLLKVWSKRLNRTPALDSGTTGAAW